MKAKFKNEELEFWEISKTGSRPQWIQQAFEKKELQWDGKHLKMLNNVFKSSALRGITGGFGTGVNVIYGDIGDFIDHTHGTIISSKKFSKNYVILDKSLSENE